MNFNFEVFLFYGVLITGIIALIDQIFWAKPRKRKFEAENSKLKNPPELKLPLIIEYSRSFFPVLLIVFLLRSFFYEPFRIPTGSLEPTLHVGDFILVNKFHYGLKLPVVHKQIIDNKTPNRGDIIVFRWPPNKEVNFIKRVIGIPGDKISYINKTLFVNGKKIPQEFLKNSKDFDSDGSSWDVVEKTENFFDVKHSIYLNPEAATENFEDVIVPDGMFFAMGDNRDFSADSRFWGFIPFENVVGKANYIWMSWDTHKTNVRWNRIGKTVK